MRQQLKRLLRSSLSFLFLLFVFFFLLWVYFYFTQGDGRAERKYVFKRNYTFCPWKLGEEVFADLFTTTRPTIHTTNAYAILDLGVKQDSMYYLLIDSTGEREKIAIPFVLNESPYNFSSYSLEWVTQNHYTHFNICTKQRTDSLFTDSLIAIHALPDSSILYFAQIDKKNKTELAFMRNAKGRTDTIHSLPNDDYSSHIEHFLAYYGYFLQYGNFITYTARHLPYVWVFDSKGKFLTTIITQDHVPAPVVVRSGNSFVLERGSSFNSNIASFVLEKQLIVFSKRLSTEEEDLVADIYNLVDGEYVVSYQIGNNKFSNSDLWSLLVFKQQLLLEFETGLYPLEFK